MSLSSQIDRLKKALQDNQAANSGEDSSVPEAWLERDEKSYRYKGPAKDEKVSEAALATFRILSE